MPDLDAIRERDRLTECVNPTCHQTAADRRALLRYIDGYVEGLDDENLRTWREERLRQIAREVTEEVLREEV